MLACIGNFFDILLGGTRHKNKATLPELEMETLDLVLVLLSDPDYCGEATLEEALTVAKGYDLYDFPKGQKLCEKIFTKFLCSLPMPDSSKKDYIDLIENLDVDKLTQVVAVAG